ncbi:MAG: cell division protein ZapB [Desulfatitalea sp.]|nr:cell division protein ZapB [Desulfatitalea sp.]
MDQETVIQQFENLENKIEHLIEACKRRDTDNEALKQKIEMLTTQLHEKEASERQNDQLRSLLRDKIDSLMGRLSEFTEA